MMNSTIASNINGTLSAEKNSFNQTIANGSRSSVLLDTIDFSLMGTKKPSSGSSIPEEFLSKLTESKPLVNGQKKLVDQNRNTFNHSYPTVTPMNGYKETIVEDDIPAPKILLYTGKIYVEWKQVHKIGAGLNNLGNTCFMNTVIQCLTYCPPLANYLLHDNDHSSKCSVTGFCMMCTLQKHMKRVIGKTGVIIKPFDVFQRLKLIAKHFTFGRQEDAHEFLRFVIDNLWKSSLSQNNNCSKLDPASKETTVINKIFGGYHRSQVTCLRCKEKSNTFDHFMDFILDIKQNVLSLEKALEKFTQPELLEQENSYKCPKCKMKVTAQKRFTVYRAPNVATFQLKRFDYNRSFGGKITKQITYPEKLNLRPYMSDSKGDPVWYRLNAVLVHSGPTCNSGHYFCYVRNSNGFWYIMDDERVHQVSVTQVLNQPAYVLFYIKAETSQGPSFKKCFENRNPVIKGNISAGNIKKNPEISLKSSPLAERNQAKVSSPTIKHEVCSPLNVNKKLSMSQNLNRERISFGIRSNVQDIRKSPNLLASSKKVKQSPNISKASNNHTGLVPYVKDSSESSDDNECNQSEISKTGSSRGSSFNLSENMKSEGTKNNFKFNKSVNDSSCKIEVRRKLSKSFLGVSRFSSTNSNGSNKFSSTISNSKFSSTVSNSTSSTPLKVIATGSWTVTDAPVVSPSAGSNCSANSVNSDWCVTSTNVDSSPETIVNKFANSNSKENGTIHSAKSLECTVPFLNNSVYSSPKQASKNISHLNSQESNTNATSSSDDHEDAFGSNSSLNKKCDFRKQQSQNEKTFLDSEKISNTHHQSSSYLKRKCSDTDKKISAVSPEFHHNESRHNSLSKKTKYTEEVTESKNGITLHNQVNVSGECVSSENEKSKDKKIKRETDSSSHSILEYVWVEKTKDSIESNHSSPIKVKPEIKNDQHSASSNMNLKVERKHDVVSELTNNSRYFYGASVPTWKGENHFKESPQSISEKRRSLDDYEDEYDRGKMRKSRPKDRYQQYYKHNPFQKYGERNHNHSKYNGNFHFGHRNHHHKPYDSQYNRKQNRNHDYHRNRNHFRPPFRR